jgi:hypothetical protein
MPQSVATAGRGNVEERGRRHRRGQGDHQHGREGSPAHQLARLISGRISGNCDTSQAEFDHVRKERGWRGGHGARRVARSSNERHRGAVH